MGLTRESIRSGPEPAITSVRWALCMLAVIGHFAVALARRDQESVIVVLVGAVLLIGGCAAVDRLARRWGRTRPLTLQVVDTAWWLGLVLFAGPLAPAGSWALLTIPIVGASIRGSELHVLSTWLVAAGAYLGITTAISQLATTETEATLNALGILLAVAAGVAVLTRWLAEGWVDQQALTESVERRREWLEHLQSSARAMRTMSPPEVIEACLQTVVDLGFDAATATGGHAASTGATSLAAPISTIDAPPPETIEVAAHEHGGGLLFSATGLEPESQTIIVAWTTENPSDELAAAMGDVIAQTTQAYGTASHLATARFEASHDALTRLANRRRLDDLLAETAAAETPAAVVFVDLDRFKPINDSHGHDVGDQVLRVLADRISDAAGDRGTAVRYGGDEFVVLLTGEHVAAANGVAEQIVRHVREPVITDAGRFVLAASVGLATHGRATSGETLVELADEQAYRAKRAGGNRVVAAPEPLDPDQVMTEQAAHLA